MIFEETKPGETFSLRKESTGKTRGALKIRNVAKKNVGQNNPMDFVDVNYGVGEVSHEAKMVLRRAYIFNMNVCIGGENEDMPESERYYQRWKYLKDRGIPTLGSMRIVDDDRVVMGDATVDGSEFFGKGRIRVVYGERDNNRKRELTEKERRFVEIYENGELEREARRVAEQMEKSGLRFPFDDYFDVIIHNDGSFEVLVMDLSGLDLATSSGDGTPDDLMYMPSRLYEGIKYMP